MVRAGMGKIGALVIAAFILGTFAQFEEEEKGYRGMFIGSLNSYHHQVCNALR